MYENLSLEQRVARAEGGQAAEYLHARHSYLHASTHGKEEWDEIWSRSDDISWAHAFGRMRGWDEVWYNSVTTYNWRGMSNYYNPFDLVPEIAYLTDFRNLSEVAMHTLATDIIEVAEDAQTARGFFLTPGVLFCALNKNNKYWGSTLWERYGSDFRYEDGEWRYLHEQVCPDMTGDFDICNLGVEEYGYAVDPASKPAPEPPDTSAESGFIHHWLKLTDPGPLHLSYSLFQPVQNTVPWPVPYKTMDNDNTYTKTNE